MTKTALITGITGQDGSYLAELLLGKGYDVHGLVRRASGFNTARIDHLYQDPHHPDARMFLHQGDMTDPVRLLTLVDAIRPDEVYNLAGQSHVRSSFEQPHFTANTIATGTLHLLEALRHSGLPSRLYQAGSSEMFGAAPPPHDESTGFAPRSPQGTAKAYAHWMTRNYREGYGLFTVNGIAFNHESPRRGETFVTRKITRAVARIQAGDQDFLYLGNLDAVRDWGYAPEYVEAMWRALQRDEPTDYLLATGTSHTVRDFVEASFEHVGLDWERHVRYDADYLRPTDTDTMQADPSRASRELGWTPAVRMPELATIMVDADVAALDNYHGPGRPWVDQVLLPGWPDLAGLG